MITVKKNSFIIYYKFITNFPPLNFETSLTKYYLLLIQKIILNDSQQKIVKQFCKNFLIFLCLCKFFQKPRNYLEKNNFLIKINIFTLPTYFKKFTFLKAPFVNKLAKKHYCLIRYKLLVSIECVFKKYFVNATNIMFITWLRAWIKLFSFFESNVCYNYKIIFSCFFSF